MSFSGRYGTRDNDGGLKESTRLIDEIYVAIAQNDYSLLRPIDEKTLQLLLEHGFIDQGTYGKIRGRVQ